MITTDKVNDKPLVLSNDKAVEKMIRFPQGKVQINDKVSAKVNDNKLA